MYIFDHSAARDVVDKLTSGSAQDPHIWLHCLTMMTSSCESGSLSKMLTDNCLSGVGEGCAACMQVPDTVPHLAQQMQMGSVLRPITFRAFADAPITVSHGFLQPALHPCASQPPWPHPHAWILVHTALVFFWLVSQLVLPFALMLLCDYSLPTTESGGSGKHTVGY